MEESVRIPMDHASEEPIQHIDENAPIVPDMELGGVRLRLPIEMIDPILRRLPERYTSTINWFQCSPPWEVRYVLGSVVVAADVRTGRIFKVTALPGYHGKYRSGLHVGMRVLDAQQVEPELYYDEASELLYIKGMQGIAFDVPEIDPDPQKVPFMLISAISVYASEIRDYHERNPET
jgi:hypothetical protein